MNFRASFLSGSSLRPMLTMLSMLMVSSASHAFDVNEGRLPDISTSTQETRAQRYVAPRRIPTSQPPVPFVAPTANEPAPIPILFAPVQAGTSGQASGEGISSTTLAARSFDPLGSTASPAPAATRPQFPAVDPEIAAKAAAELGQPAPSVAAPVSASVVATPVQPPLAAISNEPGYIAPLPLFSQYSSPKPLPPAAPIAAAPAQVVVPQIVAAPVAAAPELPPATPMPAYIARPSSIPDTPVTIAYAPPVPAVPPVPPEELSRKTKSILGNIPSKIDTVKPEKTTQVKMARVDPAMDALDIKANKTKPVEAYEASGIKISVRRPGLDTNYELNRAYTAMSGGDTQGAMQIYKDILSTEPGNADALFGLASLYHRQGQIDKARPLYGELLKRYPNHREGINNFLVMVSDEAPQEALAELVRLEQRNPDFSPIPAQQAIVLEKLGYPAEAQEKMLRAIELAPDNLTYKHNFAVMLDRQGNYAQAAGLYQLLLDASARGEPIPTDAASLQKRLNYIATLNQAAKLRG